MQIGDNSNLFDWTYVENNAYAQLLAARALMRSYLHRPNAKSERVDGEVFVIMNDEPWHFWTFTRTLAAAAGYPVSEKKNHQSALDFDDSCCLGLGMELLDLQPRDQRTQADQSTSQVYDYAEDPGHHKSKGKARVSAPGKHAGRYRTIGKMVRGLGALGLGGDGQSVNQGLLTQARERNKSDLITRVHRERLMKTNASSLNSET